MSNRIYKVLVLSVVATALVLGIAYRLQSKRPSGSPNAAPMTESEPEPAAKPYDRTTSSAAQSAAPAITDPKTPEFPAVIDLGMGQCIPCKEMKPMLDGLREEYAGRCRIEIIDIGKRPDQADKYGVIAIPTQVFFDKGGKEVYRHEGFMPRDDIVAKLKEMRVE